MAEMAAADINELPDSSFAYIEPGGTRDADGKTTPRSLRHLPIHDAAHVRNALARLSQTDIPAGAKDAAMAKIRKAAKKFGVDVNTKALGEWKAEPMTEKQLNAWLSGEISRRIVVLPFYGPLPGGKAGLDIDGEYFDETTDRYGPYPYLRSTRERLVDWHHDDAGVPDHLARMKGAILGKIDMDEEPSTLRTDEGEFDGVLANFWANAGEKRVALVRDLQRRSVPLFGSSQSVKGVRAMWPPEADGHLPVWPIIRHTITTSPQNTYAVVPPLKAVLTEPIPSEIGVAAVQAALVGLDSRWRSAQSSSAAGSGSPLAGDAPGKAGRVLSKKNLDRLERVIDLLADFRQENADRLEAALARRTQTP